MSLRSSDAVRKNTVYICLVNYRKHICFSAATDDQMLHPSWFKIFFIRFLKKPNNFNVPHAKLKITQIRTLKDHFTFRCPNFYQNSNGLKKKKLPTFKTLISSSSVRSSTVSITSAFASQMRSRMAVLSL